MNSLLPSMSDVAKAAEVSVATVSRFMNDPHKVSADAAQRVQKAIDALGYQPNVFARQLRTQRSRTLGVVLPTLLNPVFAECLTGIAQAAHEAGYAIQPLFTEYLLEREIQAVNMLLAGNVEGVVLVVSNPESSQALQRLRAQDRPYVLAYNHHSAHPCVTVDSEKAMADVVAHLVALGHTRIAMVAGQLHASDRAQKRVKGYESAMLAHGLQAGSITEVPFLATATQCIGELLQTSERPTALIASNDLLAMRCMRAALLLGLQVPQQLSIVGFDGVQLLQELHPQLATVRQPNDRIGRHCVQLLMQSIEARQVLAPSDSVLLPYAFDAGQSCSPAGAGALDVDASQ